MVTSRSSLIVFEVLQVDEVDGQSVNRDFHAHRVAILEVNPWQGRYDVDTAGRIAELYYLILHQKVFVLQTQRSETELLYGPDQAFGVLFIQTNPHVYIFGVARMTVERRDRVAANHQIAYSTPV